MHTFPSLLRTGPGPHAFPAAAPAAPSPRRLRVPLRGESPAGILGSEGFVALACAGMASALAAQRRCSRSGGGVGPGRSKAATHSTPRPQALARTRCRATEVDDVEVSSTPTAQSWGSLETGVLRTPAGQALQQASTEIEAGLRPHTDAKVRYFGEGRGTPRVTLYRDSAAWCPYCQKVWLLLEAKEVDFAVGKINMRSYGNKPKEFLQRVPRGLLPAVEIDGRMMTESLEIMFTLERTFFNEGRPMFPPAAAPERPRAEKLLELERAIFGAWCGFLFRPELPFIGGSASDFRAALGQMDDELRKTSSPWFLSYDHPTIVDMQYVSHVERMVASAHFYKGLDIREEYPNIDRWLAAFEALPYYMATKSDYYTHCQDIPPQYGTPFPNDSESSQRVRMLLDPQRSSVPLAWTLDPEPRTQLQATVAEADHRVEAAWGLIKNYTAVAKFCCRAAGSGVGDWARGNPTRSELADPYAQPNDGLLGSVEAALRAVATGLYLGEPQVPRAARKIVEEAAPGADFEEVALCLEYLRDRVGVPRDMQMPAAKLLRAYLAEAVRSLRI